MSDTPDWMKTSRKKVKDTKGQLPNPDAPKLVFDKKVPKSQLPIRIVTPAYKELSKLIKLKQIAGNKDASMQGLVLKGIDVLLKKNGLHSLDDLANGAVFDEKDAEKLNI